MALTYTERVQHTTTKTVERTVEVPDEWGMYTNNGNRIMKKKAEKFVAEVEAATSFSQKVAAFERYFKAWVKASENKTTREASDTEVRECVWFFAARVGKACGVNNGTLNDLWEASY